MINILELNKSLELNDTFGHPIYIIDILHKYYVYCYMNCCLKVKISQHPLQKTIYDKKTFM